MFRPTCHFLNFLPLSLSSSFVCGHSHSFRFHKWLKYFHCSSKMKFPINHSHKFPLKIMSSSSIVVIGIFLSVLCDNLLLTVVVPILPEFLREKAALQLPTIASGAPPLTVTNASSSIVVNNAKCWKQLFHLQMLDEDVKLGLLFSTKAIVQLIANPFVGRLTIIFGYKTLLCTGNFILMICSLAFGFGESYIFLMIGRSFHGIGSSLITISGLALVAQLYSDDRERTRVLGRVMGAGALGVLIGYPFGGLLYSTMGKTIPFVIIAGIALLNAVIYSRWNIHTNYVTSPYPYASIPDSQISCVIHNNSETQPKLTDLLKDRSILIIVGAIWVSTTAMATLEPTLPVWLIETIDPPKWKLGLVFVPDSIGYFLGTNFFGQIALNVGRWKMSMISLVGIGIACLILPLGKEIWQLGLPHFTLGLGLGIVDASLMPLLAYISDSSKLDSGSQPANYGVVYSLAQTSVSLAYALGPFFGGQIVRQIGFPDLIRLVGIMNLTFCPFLGLLSQTEKYASKYQVNYTKILASESSRSNSNCSESTTDDVDEESNAFSSVHHHLNVIPTVAAGSNGKHVRFQIQEFSIQPKTSKPSGSASTSNIVGFFDDCEESD